LGKLAFLVDLSDTVNFNDLRLIGPSGNGDYITSAIPFFFLLIFLEMFLLRFAQLPSAGAQYDFADLWSSLAAGTGQRMWVVCIYKLLL
jgi:hypothetical protein